MNTDSYEGALEAFQLGKLRKAYSLISKSKAPSYKALKLKLQIQYQLKQYVPAAIVGEALLKFNVDNKEQVEVSFFTSICYNNANDKVKAIALLERCVHLDSSANNAVALFNLLCIYYQEGYYTKAVKLSSKLISLNEYFVKVQLILMKISAITGNKETLYKHCLKLLPHINILDVVALVDLAEFLIDMGDYESAKKIIYLFELKKSTNALNLKMKIYLQQEDYSSANDLLTDRLLLMSNKPSLFYIKANICHKQAQYNNAFNYYSQAGQLRHNEWAQEKVEDNIKKWNKYVNSNMQFTSTNATKKLRLEQTQSVNPLVFIFGFPRSGTTLLDNIIDTQSNVIVLSEMGIIPRVVARVEKLIKSFPFDIDKIKPSEIITLRHYYFDLVSELHPNLDKNTLVVDKGPHHTELLPFLQKLFPEAKFIASIRHPVDVCLSCFQQNFEFNSPNSKLTTIDHVVERYCQTFSLLERYEKELSIEVTSIKYEDIVFNFEESIEGLFEVLGIQPDESYKQFDKHAANKYITSASRGQTEQALYSTAVYKWKNYEDQLSPYIGKLQYFIEKYGYAV